MLSLSNDAFYYLSRYLSRYDRILLRYTCKILFINTGLTKYLSDNLYISEIEKLKPLLDNYYNSNIIYKVLFSNNPNTYKTLGPNEMLYYAAFSGHISLFKECITTNVLNDYCVDCDYNHTHNPEITKNLSNILPSSLSNIRNKIRNNYNTLNMWGDTLICMIFAGASLTENHLIKNNINASGINYLIQWCISHYNINEECIDKLQFEKKQQKLISLSKYATIYDNISVYIQVVNEGYMPTQRDVLNLLMYGTNDKFIKYLAKFGIYGANIFTRENLRGSFDAKTFKIMNTSGFIWLLKTNHINISLYTIFGIVSSWNIELLEYLYHEYIYPEICTGDAYEKYNNEEIYKNIESTSIAEVLIKHTYISTIMFTLKNNNMTKNDISQDTIKCISNEDLCCERINYLYNIGYPLLDIIVRMCMAILVDFPKISDLLTKLGG